MSASSRPEAVRQSIQFVTGDVTLAGDLAVPPDPQALVIFVHGSGSSRHSPRNQAVAGALQAGGLATLLFDLLTADEERTDQVTRHLRFDIDLLARRTVGAVDWLRQQTPLPLALFGASTGAAAALMAAAHRPRLVRAVVSRGGRPDLAGAALAQVQCAVLLVVGSQDAPVIDLNRRALGQLPAGIPKELVIVPGATHLFAEPGTLEQVARQARDWVRRHVPAPGTGAG